MHGQAGGQLALLIRGELLHRYPNTVIYAVEATPDHRPSDHQSIRASAGCWSPISRSSGLR